jgi:hypothetical protein
MKLDLAQIFPEELSDKEASHLADIFIELAFAVESHYYSQIVRYSESLANPNLDDVPYKS